MERNDFATSKEKQTEVIQIDTAMYRCIFTQTQLAVSLEKIDFLMRYVPHLRDEDKVGYEALKKLETQFVKEEFTRGYHVITQGASNEFFYYIFKGQCRLLLSTRLPPMAQVFPSAVRERWEWLILDKYHKGQSFGEITAVNKIPSPYTIEVCSEKAVLLKIHINDFLWKFGGEEGEPMMSVRSKIIMKTNWLRMKK